MTKFILATVVALSAISASAADVCEQKSEAMSDIVSSIEDGLAQFPEIESAEPTEANCSKVPQALKLMADANAKVKTIYSLFEEYKNASCPINPEGGSLDDAFAYLRSMDQAVNDLNQACSKK